MEQFDNSPFPKRKNPRMSHYDYTQPGYYFITICTKDKKCIFGAPCCLNPYGQAAKWGLDEIEKHTKGIKVDKYVVMPNHIHAILVLTDNTADLSVVVGQYKSAVTRRIHEKEQNIKVWQASYHDHVIRNEQDYLKIWNYIDTNPIRWEKDCFFTEPAESLEQG